MSKIGKKPILIPQGLTVDIKDGVIVINGKNGTISLRILNNINIEVKDDDINFSPRNNSKQVMANWGTMRALVNNAIIGVDRGFEKVLKIEGIGYKANLDGNSLILNIGFSHVVKFNTPEGIKIVVEKNIIKISGIDKNLVGQTAADIRAFKKPEPYKGKGIRYEGEIVKIKAGKKMAEGIK